MCSPSSSPELIEEDKTKQANVVLDQQRIALAKEVVEVAKADVAAALARQRGRGDPGQVPGRGRGAGTRRSSGSGARPRGAWSIPGSSSSRPISSSRAPRRRDKAAATIKRTKAELLSAQATLAKAEVDVRVAEADLKVAESEQRYAKAWVDYLTLTAPFDGVITGRNANTYDFVLPTTGDPTAFYLSPDISPGGTAPIYVVDRTDIVRIFVDIPEQDANYVHTGSKATVLAKAYRDQPIPGTVTRISWALNMKSRTLPRRDRPSQPRQPALARDLRLRQFDHRAARRAGTAGVGADLQRRQGLLWTPENGHAVRTEVETGVGGRQSGSRSPIAAFRAPRQHPQAMNTGRRSTGRSR